MKLGRDLHIWDDPKDKTQHVLLRRNDILYAVIQSPNQLQTDHHIRYFVITFNRDLLSTSKNSRIQNYLEIKIDWRIEAFSNVVFLTKH